MHDSHIHMALEPLKTNIEEIVENFISNDGKYILSQGTDILDFEDTLEIKKKYPKVVQVALGLHPTFFEENTVQKGRFKNISQISQEFLEKFENIFEENIQDISAVGECGLDYYQFSFDKSMDIDVIEEIKEIQRRAFRKHIDIAKKYDLPLSIHARDVSGSKECMTDILEILAEEGKGTIRGSFHSYTGNICFVEDILDLGFHIGFNAIITYKSGEDVRDILRKTPLERILFETDGPFLPPQSVRKNKKIREKFAQPSDVREIMEIACEVKNIDMETLEKITDGSYKDLFVKQG